MDGTRIENWTHSGGDGTYRLCAISGSEICRKFEFGSSWNTLALGWMADVDTSGSWIQDDPGMYFGLTSNNGSLLQGTTPNFVGLKLVYPPYASATHATYDMAYMGNPYSKFVAVSGSTEYSSSATTVYVGFAGYETSTTIGPAVVGIIYTKSGTNISMDVRAVGYGSTVIPMTRDVFIAGLNSGDIGALTTYWASLGQSVGSYGTVTYGAKESEYGELDSVSICFPNTDQRLKISTVAARIWA